MLFGCQFVFKIQNYLKCNPLFVGQKRYHPSESNEEMLLLQSTVKDKLYKVYFGRIKVSGFSSTLEWNSKNAKLDDTWFFHVISVITPYDIHFTRAKIRYTIMQLRARQCFELKKKEWNDQKIWRWDENVMQILFVSKSRKNIVCIFLDYDVRWLLFILYLIYSAIWKLFSAFYTWSRLYLENSRIFYNSRK